MKHDEVTIPEPYLCADCGRPYSEARRGRQSGRCQECRAHHNRVQDRERHREYMRALLEAARKKD